MKRRAVFVTLLLGLMTALPLAAAEMSAPILRTTIDEIIITTYFSAFDADKEYRIGVGAPGSGMGEVKILLQKDGADLSESPMNFKQGYTSTWFGVDAIDARGYVFGKGETPGDRISVRISMSRDQADSIGKFYIFIARKYGADRWYLEDGTDVDKSNW